MGGGRLAGPQAQPAGSWSGAGGAGAGAAALGWKPWLEAQQFACTQVMLESEDGESAPPCAVYVWLKCHHNVLLSVYPGQQLRARMMTGLCTHKGTCNQPSTAAHFVPFFFAICMLHCLAHVNTFEMCGCSKQACTVRPQGCTAGRQHKEQPHMWSPKSSSIRAATPSLLSTTVCRREASAAASCRLKVSSPCSML